MRTGWEGQGRKCSTGQKRRGNGTLDKGIRTSQRRISIYWDL